MSASSVKSPNPTARVSQHKRKKSNDEVISRKKLSTTSWLQSVDSFSENTGDAQSRQAEDGSDPCTSNLQIQPIASLQPSMSDGDGNVQSREPAGEGNHGFPIATEMYFVGHKDGDMRDEVVSSITLFQASSNCRISNSNIITTGGNANFFQFGDGQFTQVQKDLISNYIAEFIATVLPDINDNLKKRSLTQLIINLPRAEAVFNDYQNKKKSGPCFKGTRVALLREMADWVTGSSESRMYVLSGLAGIGKSTIAYTIAARTADLGLLGASFFFSRDEADRNNAKKFFTTIAYQFCVYDETFAKAIGDALLTECGSAATTKDPQEQLRALILDPLRSIVESRTRPILIVVDALDECDESDEHAVVMGLSQLVRCLPSFKVILTTRPQPLVNYLFCNHDGHMIFYLQDIEDKVVDSDIRLYLSHSLSLEQVRMWLRNPNKQWSANDEDIEPLVKAAGRLFIIASTTVRFILDRVACNPAAQMRKLLRASGMPFKDLNEFYMIILRNVVPEDCEDEIVNRYQSVVGTILSIQRPLPVSALAHLIDCEEDEINVVLEHLQAVILLGDDDIPRIYHKSFPDFVTDPLRCKEVNLRIDPRTRHTQIAIQCFKIMNKYLKYNILGLSDAARFMSNDDGILDGIMVNEEIPLQLFYSCAYWGNHFEIANIEDADLMNELAQFVDKHLLHWFEALSLIGKLGSAHLAIRVVLKLLVQLLLHNISNEKLNEVTQKLLSSELHQLLSDALRFISKFYEVIKRSALHTYYSALPFTPTDSLLYRRYIKEAMCVFSIEGVPRKWDALIANLNHGEYCPEVIKFSRDSTVFVSYNEVDITLGMLKIWDATTGTPISSIPGKRFAVTNDLSTVASSEYDTVTFYNINGSTLSVMFTTSSKVHTLALSSESNRVATALFDGTVWLRDSRNAEWIDTFDGFEDNEGWSQLEFSSTGTRLAYLSSNNIVKLRDGFSGRFIADLPSKSRRDCYQCYVVFSADGSRIASQSNNCLTLWNSENGRLIGTAMDSKFRVAPAISANGSLLATVTRDNVQLRSGSCVPLAQIAVTECPKLITFSLDNILAIACQTVVKFYNVETRSFISTIPYLGLPMALNFSPDCTRLALGIDDGTVYLWDTRNTEASSLFSKEQATVVTGMAFSRDCSRLACGFKNGVVELWRTSPTKQRIASHQVHKRGAMMLEFSPDGRLFASGSDEDEAIKLWNSGDGTLRGILEVHHCLWAIAVSNSIMASSGMDCVVSLWTLDTLSLIHAFDKTQVGDSPVSISDDSHFVALASGQPRRVRLFDVLNRTMIATFDVPGGIHTMAFLPDNSQFVTQSYRGAFQSFNLVSKEIIKGPTLNHLIRLPNVTCWHGVPIWHCWDSDNQQDYFVASFPQHKSPVPVLWSPPVTKWVQGSTMIGLACEDGRIILLRLSSSSQVIVTTTSS